MFAQILGFPLFEMPHRGFGFGIGGKYHERHIHYAREPEYRPLVHRETVLLVGILPLDLLDAEAKRTFRDVASAY